MTANKNQPSPHPLSNDSAALPSDRDERAAAPTENDQHRQNREMVEQGRRDVEAGIEDTDRIGIPNAVPASKENEKD